MDAVTIYGIAALTFMMAMYALERRGARFILAFAAGCALSSTYGFLSGASWPPGPAWGLRLLGECSLLVLRKTADVAASDGPSAGSQLAHPSQALGAGSEDPPRSQSSYRFPLPPPLPNPARMPRLPPCSLFSFDRRWSIFLRPLSCFCFATRTPISGGEP